MWVDMYCCILAKIYEFTSYVSIFAVGAAASVYPPTSKIWKSQEC